LKKSQTLFITLFLSAAVASAGPKPQSGNILSQTSVACGTKKSKKQDIHLLCHQYVVRSGNTDYTIRQPKLSELAIIPLNTAIEFKLDKDKMKFKADGQSLEFMIISQAAASSATTGLFQSKSSGGTSIERMVSTDLFPQQRRLGNGRDSSGHRGSFKNGFVIVGR